MSIQAPQSRLIKDPATLTEFLDASFRGELHRRILMVVGNRLVGDSRVLKSAISLADRGFEVVLVGSRPLTDDFAIGHLSGLPYILVNSDELSLGADAAGHESAMRAIGLRLARGLATANFSIVYSHDFWGLDLGFHVMQGLSYKLPLYWIHDIHEYIKGYEGILPAGRLAYAISTERRRIALPDQLVFVNERIGDLICKDLEIGPEGRLIVHNAPRQQIASKFNLRAEIGLAPEVPLGVYLGRATAARGLDVLIPALGAIPGLHFALLSSAANDYIAQLRSAAEAAGVSDRLHTFRYVPDTEVASAAASATFGLSPLTRYGNADLAVPTKMLEFIHARLPMVVSDATFQADFVREHGLGEVYPATDANAFIAAVQRVLAAPPAPDWSALQARYAWDAQFEGVIDHLEAYASHGRPKSRGVFQGPGPSAGQPGILSRALRARGAAAQSINLSMTTGLSHQSDAYWPASAVFEQASLAMWAARRFDVLHLHFRPIINIFAGAGYDPASFADLALAHEAGKRVVFQFRGSEIRLNAEFRKCNPFAWPEAEDPSGMPDSQKLLLLQHVRENADVILVPDVELQTYVPEARIVQRAVELKKLAYVGAKRKERPKVCHAPTRRGAKGTDEVLEAVKKLQAEGVDFEFTLLEGLAHKKLLAVLADADIVIDQLLIGWYGVLSVEAMALGKAVIAYIRDDLVDEVPNGVLVNANPLTIEDRLRELIADHERRVSLGKAARAFVERYHAADVVAKRLEEVYREAQQAASNGPSHSLFMTQIEAAQKVSALTRKVAAVKKAAAAAEVADAKPAKAAIAKQAGAKGERTLATRLAHMTPAKVVNRIGRILGIVKPPQSRK
ncbi:MAG: glycosyltransferase [Rhizobacter sp.]|nr:glycosyltransferase [Rhizobacter sp.]